MQTTEQKKLKIHGRHFVKVYNATSSAYKKIEAKIIEHINKPWYENHRQDYQALVKQLDRFVTRQYVVDNLVTTRGRSVLAARLANDTTYTGILNYGALGSSATAPANGDTQLTAEVFRKVTASASFTDNIAFIDFFYSKTDTNGTYEEFGTFIDGTGSANSGRIFTHALTGGWVKSSSESMTVACQYTIT